MLLLVISPNDIDMIVFDSIDQVSITLLTLMKQQLIEM